MIVENGNKSFVEMFEFNRRNCCLEVFRYKNFVRIIIIFE
uniref:Uncharacterized protein n=1 Tax=Brugia timori TaxID=42155 RepID=A0A0R3QVW7_9BILA